MSTPVVSSNLTRSATAIEIYRGEYKVIKITVKDAAGDAFDLTDATVFFTARKAITDPLPYLSKTSSVTGEINITSPKTAGLIEIPFLTIDTLNMDTGEYVFDVWIEMDVLQGETYPRRHQLIAASQLIIKMPVTAF